MGSKPLPVPSSTSEITPDWVQLVTGHNVIQEGFTIEGDIQAGIGFLSSICRISYQTKSGEAHNLIVKLLPTNSTWLDHVNNDLSDEREIKFYTIVLPDLLKSAPEIEENVCVFYNGTVVPANPELGTKRQSMLVMEDLKPLGFQMMDFAGSDSETILQDLINFLARLHFGAYSIEIEKGASLPQLYPFIQGVDDDGEWQSTMEDLCVKGFKLLEELLTTLKIPSHVWTAYEKLKPIISSIVKKVDENGRTTPVLIHNDLWPSNIMIHESLPVKILDWQQLAYRNVAYELSTTLVCCMTKEELSKDNLRKWIRRYYDEFERLCQNHQNGDKIKRKSWEEFEEFFFTWGSAFIFVYALAYIDCLGKDYPKYINGFKVLNDELNIPEFLEKECGTQ